MKCDYKACAQWSALADQVLLHADPAWWHGVPHELIEGAKRTPIGRRMLSEQLATKIAPNLFQLMRPLSADEQRRYSWMIGPIRQLRDKVTDLGALSLSPAIRQTVNGDAVGLLRDVLTEERYAWTLSAADPWRGQVPSDVQQGASVAIRSSMGSATELSHLIQGCGLRELRECVRDVHAGLQELLRLCFSPHISAQGPGPWLPKESVAACLSFTGSKATVTA